MLYVSHGFPIEIVSLGENLGFEFQMHFFGIKSTNSAVINIVSLTLFF